MTSHDVGEEPPTVHLRDYLQITTNDYASYSLKDMLTYFLFLQDEPAADSDTSDIMLIIPKPEITVHILGGLQCTV